MINPVHFSHSCIFYFYIPFSLYRAQTLEVLLSSYYSKKKRFLIYLVNKVCPQLRPICLTSLHMDSFELWMVGNVLSQSIKKCYYLIDNLWHFVVNAHHHICISTYPACIFNSCIALNKILCFIKGQLCSVGDKDIDCPHCLLTLKHQLVFYLKLSKNKKVEARLIPISCIQTLYSQVVTLSEDQFHNF